MIVKPSVAPSGMLATSDQITLVTARSAANEYPGPLEGYLYLLQTLTCLQLTGVMVPLCIQMVPPVALRAEREDIECDLLTVWRDKKLISTNG